MSLIISMIPGELAYGHITQLNFHQTRVRSLATLVSNWLNRVPIWLWKTAASGLVNQTSNWLTHWLTDSLTHSCLVVLIDVTMACEDANSKLVKVVTFTHVDDEKRADNSLVQIWKVKFGHKVKFLFILWAQGFKVWSRFWSWFLVKILKMSDQDLWYDLKKLLW